MGLPQSQRRGIFTTDFKRKLSINLKLITDGSCETLTESLNFSWALVVGLWKGLMKISEPRRHFSGHGIVSKPKKMGFSLLTTGVN